MATIVEMDPLCPVCGLGVKQPLCDAKGYAVWRCRFCASDFVWPQPSEAELKAYYDSQAYFQGGAEGSYQNYDADTEAVLPLFRELLGSFSAGEQRSILDIGCAYGTHLAAAAEMGWHACGVELSDHARKIAVARHGDKISVFASLSEIPKREYELITLFDVLEHLPDPYKIFAEMTKNGLVGEKTVIAITTPNARSSHAIANPANWEYRYPPAHLVYYSAESLQTLWARIGVGNVEVSGIYPIDHVEPSAYPDEVQGINQFSQDFAGLLCLAKDVGAEHRELTRQHTVINDFLQQLKINKQYIGRLTAEVAVQNSDLAIRDQSIANMEEYTRFLEKECEALAYQQVCEALAHLQQGRLFLLKSILASDIRSWRNILRSCYRLTALMTPAALRKRLAPLVAWLRSSALLRSLLASQEKRECYEAKILQPEIQANRPKVLHVIANFKTGGSSRLVVDLFEHLGHLYEQEVVTQFDPAPPNFAGIPIHGFRKHQSQKEISAYLSRFQPELVHIHYWGSVDKPWYAKMINAIRPFGFRVVENVNTPVAPYVDACISRYVYVSDYVKSTFGNLGGSSLTIYPGSNFHLFTREAAETIPDDCIGMVYRLDIDKLNQNSIDVFIKVAQKRPQTKIIIVGGGPFLEPYNAAVKAHNVESEFTFTGFVPYEKLPALYAQMSLFVAPVWNESFGQVSPFAMGLGIPVVGYNVGALAEILGDSSLLAAPEDSDALAEIIISLLDDRQRRKQIGQRNRERANNLYSVESMVGKYAKLYRELIGNR